MTPEQCRGARARLRWPVHRLAAEAGLARNTVLTFENERQVSADTVVALRTALERQGFTFVDTVKRSTIHWDK